MDKLLSWIIKTDLRIILCIAFLILIGYSLILASPFKTIDDDDAIVLNHQIHDLKNIPSFFKAAYFKAEQAYYRPLVSVTYALEYRLFGLDPFGFELDNILLHILNTILVFQIALLFLNDRKLSFFCTLLFAVHPIHWESVSLITNRATLLFALFALSGFFVSIKFLREGRHILLTGAVICHGLALLCKESALVFIPVLAAYIFMQNKRSWRQALFFLPFTLTDLVYLTFRRTLNLKDHLYWPSLKQAGLGIASAFHGILVYIKLLFIPLGLYFDRTQEIYQTLLCPQLIMTLLISAALTATLCKTYKRIPGIFLFLLIWFFIELLPVSGIAAAVIVYPGGISMAEHFMYVASVPAFILMVKSAEYGLKSIKGNCPAELQGTARLCFFCFLFLILVFQVRLASDESAMLRLALNANPRNVRLQSALGMSYVKNGDLDSAIEHFRRAVEISPMDAKYRIQLGAALANKGDYLEAAREYEKVPPGSPYATLLENNKRAVYEALRKKILKPAA